MRVGTTVKLKVACLGNDIGAEGVVYENYEITPLMSGISVIFENGRYDGFSKEREIGKFLEEVSFCEALANYQFKNVIALEGDFRRGVFASAFANKN